MKPLQRKLISKFPLTFISFSINKESKKFCDDAIDDLETMLDGKLFTKHEKEEFKRKKKKIQSQKDPSALNSNHLTETVLKRMQSDQLNSFMQQTEI